MNPRVCWAVDTAQPVHPPRGAPYPLPAWERRHTPWWLSGNTRTQCNGKRDTPPRAHLLWRRLPCGVAAWRPRGSPVAPSGRSQAEAGGYTPSRRMPEPHRQRCRTWSLLRGLAAWRSVAGAAGKNPSGCGESVAQSIVCGPIYSASIPGLRSTGSKAIQQCRWNSALGWVCNPESLHPWSSQ